MTAPPDPIYDTDKARPAALTADPARAKRSDMRAATPPAEAAPPPAAQPADLPAAAFSGRPADLRAAYSNSAPTGLPSAAPLSAAPPAAQPAALLIAASTAPLPGDLPTIGTPVPVAAPPLLLITRPEAAARRFAAQVAGLGLATVIAPLMRIVPVPHDRAALAGARGLVFTSENAVPWAGPGRGRPAFCVGGGTARAAAAAGFAVTQGPGDAAGLRPMLERADLGGWLHPHGAHLAAALPVPGVVVYDQQSLPLPQRAVMALAGDGPVIWPLFSPRSARLAAEAAHGARAPLWLAAISPAADAAWTGPAARRAMAATPDAPGVIGAIEALLGREPSPSPRLEPCPAPV